ncbi:MAG: hypothetical protein A2087_02480 [Spirochaetes bacterium GWD1_61_31]|nr:MAG: hypothetical protein A2Y37_13975 [Spirochaetes bacterium GWB1_60_80]OHD31081.1 MAG: hypothetical protein A2004_07785 [Spirochaetes bacterium GWC1_61_12]OHD38154.1 MAG: hypothetical protein A2087_02480 [Spirochaetes bacterium GWD1_61_31]OHD45298.1 MAG: hypothetical protein A2Y35_02555 [Spirochaetes bacterium GWE1_60_18]OHD59604.1 MAG: hypothetical protein A2Y32_12800 [Spirochaetes bacterium GWF1_60_12]HAP43985.1 hypothetical protein [Spirochaetaceae bacterium]
MTEATIQALNGLRDFSTLQWYVIPLLAIVFYIYTTEIKKARASGDWKAILAGAAVFGADFFNETWNGWFMTLSGRSALWTTPGPTALRTMVGWNIEIMFMFLILGIIWYHSLSGKKGAKLLGIDERWFFALAFSAICVAIECVLNAGGHLVWEYRFWERTIPGVPLIYLIGYFWFFAWAILATSRKTTKGSILVVCAPYAAALVLNLAAAALGWRY